MMAQFHHDDDVLRWHGLELKQAVEMEAHLVAKNSHPVGVKATEYIRRGRMLMAESRTAEAHAAFCLAINTGPHSAEAQALAALTWLLLGAPHLALQHAQRALIDTPFNADALLALAGAAQRIGNTEVADMAAAALTNFPEADSFYKLLCLSSALDKGDFEVALFQLADMIEQEPENIHCKELFLSGFMKFLATGARCEDFIESVGLSPPITDPIPASEYDAPDRDSIDIVIPVFDAVNELAACLSSIERWWSKAIRRIILVDDASSQGTATWIDNYVATSSKAIVVRRQENGGFTTSVISGLNKSDAPFFILLNSDTIVGPGWIDRLWYALTRRWTTAMAGPVSNSAYFQTIIPPDGQSLGLIVPRFNAELDIETAAAITLLGSRKVYPRVPLLSGFCLLLRRDLYDLAGGLDADSFPRGYWEVQDLSLRLLDLGFDSVLADDVYVHHSGSKSIDDERREVLNQQGRRRMHEKHSALRLMTAEAITSLEPEIAHLREFWHHYSKEQASRRTVNAPHEPFAEGHTRRPVKPLRTLSSDISQQEVCLFVTHAPLGQVSEYTLHYLHALRDHDLRIVLCPIVQDLDMPLQSEMVDMADSVIPRLDGGYDFAAWADLLQISPSLWDARRLYFVNDSLVGPFSQITSIVNQIRDRDAGFFALSECTNSSYHAQSFFFGWNRTNLSSPLLRAFWDSVVVHNEKNRVVLEYEYKVAPLSHVLPDSSQDFIFGMQTIFDAQPVDISCINPTHHAWRHMLTCGFPFVKTDLLRDGAGPIDVTGWEEICQMFGADIDAMHRHIERSRIYRTHYGYGNAIQPLLSALEEK